MLALLSHLNSDFLLASDAAESDMVLKAGGRNDRRASRGAHLKKLAFIKKHISWRMSMTIYYMKRRNPRQNDF